MYRHNIERRRIGRVGGSQAAVLGANDGVLSVAGLILGVAAAHGSLTNVLIAGAAGLAGGALSMAAGEYVSVQSQADAEQADLERERRELNTDDDGEHRELAAIYVGRGLDPALAKQVADALMRHDALGAHARDERGLSETLKARPLQAALAAAVSFALGAALPLCIAAAAPLALMLPAVAGASLAALALLGGLAAGAGGAHILNGALRVLFWGAITMASTVGIGVLLGAVV